MKLKYWAKKLLGLWPPSKNTAKRLVYDLNDADEKYSGEP